jgi:hypothetical protein
VTATAAFAAHRAALAARCGFAESGPGLWKRGDLALRREGRWLRLEAAAPAVGDPLRAMLGRPGFWRALRDGESCVRAFDVPPLTVDGAGDAAPGEDVPSALLGWAEATLAGDLPDRGDVPSAEEVDTWIGPAQRHVRAGGRVVAVEVVVGARRLAFRIPALARIPAELPPARRAWLEAVCHDAQRRWRLVRLGIDDASACVCAEVDLSGAPPGSVEPLARLGMGALAVVAAWALPALSVITDPRVRSEALDQDPRGAGALLEKGGRRR